jgi:carboxylesterase
VPDPRAAFELDGDGRGVLLVHGFTGTPFEVRLLGERLHERGLTVVGLRLPGHGTSAAELDRTRWTDWAAHVEGELDRLRERCARVAIVGQSLGGLLSLHLAARRGHDLAAVASLAAPLWLFRAPRALVAALRRVPPLGAALRPIRKRGGSDVADLAMRIRNPSYPVIPLRALVELDRAREAIRAELPRVRVPLLLVHAIQDHVAPYSSMAEIAARVGSSEIHTLTLPRSYHVVAIDLERERVAAAVGGFLEAHLGPATAAAPTRSTTACTSGGRRGSTPR